MDFSKTFYFLFKTAHLTPALINASRQNNAELGPAEKGPIRYPKGTAQYLSELRTAISRRGHTEIFLWPEHDVRVKFDQASHGVRRKC